MVCSCYRFIDLKCHIMAPGGWQGAFHLFTAHFPFFGFTGSILFQMVIFITHHCLTRFCQPAKAIYGRFAPGLLPGRFVCNLSAWGCSPHCIFVPTQVKEWKWNSDWLQSSLCLLDSVQTLTVLLLPLLSKKRRWQLMSIAKRSFILNYLVFHEKLEFMFISKLWQHENSLFRNISWIKFFCGSWISGQRDETLIW